MERDSKDAFEAHLYHIRESISDVKIAVRDIQKTVAKQEKVLLRNTITVEDHKRRSDVLEKNQAEFVATQHQMVSKIKDISVELEKIDMELRPIKKHVKSVENLASLFITLNDNKALIGKVLAFLIVIIVSAYYNATKINEFLIEILN
jgi:hypothetical protein